MSADPTRLNVQNNPLTAHMHGYTVHGNKYFDVPYMSEIAGNLWQGGCISGLILPLNVRHVISLYPWEAYTVRHELLSYMQVQMYDSTDQAVDQVEVLSDWVNICRNTGPVLVHCQAGLNRSSLIAARALMKQPQESSGYRQQSLSLRADEAIALLREKRSPACLCNPAFEEFLRSWDNL
jgi:protein-tyrosine phosphatase